MDLEIRGPIVKIYNCGFTGNILVKTRTTLASTSVDTTEEEHFRTLLEIDFSGLHGTDVDDFKICLHKEKLRISTCGLWEYKQIVDRLFEATEILEKLPSAKLPQWGILDA